MATKVFSKALMTSEYDISKLASVVFQEDGENAAIMDGSFVVLGDLIPNEAYGNNVPDYNTYYASAPTATTDPVVMVDIAGVSEGVIAGNTYKIGVKQVDLQGQPGYSVRARIPELHDKFWLGEGCFATVPTVNQFAVLTANDVILTPAEEAADSGFCVKIQAAKDLTLGQFVNKAGDGYEKLYLCEVVKL